MLLNSMQRGFFVFVVLEIVFGGDLIRLCRQINVFYIMAKQTGSRPLRGGKKLPSWKTFNGSNSYLGTRHNLVSKKRLSHLNACVCSAFLKLLGAADIGKNGIFSIKLKFYFCPL